jgi:DNA repair photolyase
MTKLASWQLASQLYPEYLRIIEGWKELVIQPTIPCLDQLEPFAPPTHTRVKVVSELINFGYDIRVRIDPIVPPELGGQTEDTIYRHIGDLAEAGVKFTISKVVHKAVGVKKVYPDFYEKMDSYFKVNRSPESAFVLKDELRRKLLLPVCEACKLHGIKLALCSDGDLGLPGCLPCDGLC